MYSSWYYILIIMISALLSWHRETPASLVEELNQQKPNHSENIEQQKLFMSQCIGDVSLESNIISDTHLLCSRCRLT